jgi:hypothetical protein
VHTRRGGTSSDGDTSACTSTSSGREPSIAARTTLPGAFVRLPDEPGARVEHLREAARLHLEDADVVRRAEAVLQRAQRAVGALALALELEHAVDEVLEDARTGERALLRDMADEQDGGARPLGDLRDPRGDLAHLAHGAGRAVQRGAVERLDRVDHAGGGPLGAQGGEHGVEVGLRQDRHVESACAQALGAQADLGGGLLARDVERRLPRRREMAEGHVRERGLADARRAAEQDERAGDETAAEHPVELADAGAQARHALDRDVAQRNRPRRRPAAARAGTHGGAPAARARGGRALLDERVPLAAARAAAVPFRALRAAGRAGEDGRRSRHSSSLGRGPVELAPLTPAGDAASHRGAGGCGA